MAETEEVNALGLSDEEVMNMPLPDDPEPEQEEANEQTNEESTNPEQEVGDGESNSQEESDTSDESGGERSEGEGGSEGDQGDTGGANPDGGSEDGRDRGSDSQKEKKKEKNSGVNGNDEQEKTSNEDSNEGSKKETNEIDPQAQLDILFTPFRANGKEIKINSVQDAISLMQMGANYNKKMTGLKPVMKLVKKLENNDLLDEAKLDFLIDLDKKNPDAIRKLMKDAEIDPLEVDLDKAAEYTPSTYTVDDKEVELDTVLDDIKSSDSYSTTIDIIGNKWDASSKQVLVDQPNLIRVINDHVSSGVYEQITTVVESERMLGRLQGLSDLEAYRQVGDAIQARGGFAGQQTTNSATDKVEAKKVDKVIDPKLNDKKRAAGSSKSTPGGGKKKDDYNPLSMSDEDFEKLPLDKF